MKFFRHVFGTFATELITVALNFGVGVVTARLLSPADRGVLALVMLLPVTLAYFADPGVSQAIIYQIGRRGRSPSQVTGNALTLAVVFGVAAAALAWLLRPWLLKSVLADVPPLYFGLALLLLPLLLVDSYLLSVLRALQEFGRFNVRRLFSPLVLLFGALGLGWAAGWGLQGVVLAYFVSQVLSLLLSLFLLGRRADIRPRFERSLTGEALDFGVKSYLQNLMGHLHYRVDIYLLALFLPPAQVAFYAVATSVAEVAFYLPNSVGMVLFPRLAAESDLRIHPLTAEVTRHTLLVSTLSALALSAAGILLIPLVYGAEYRGAVLPFIALMPGVLNMAVYKVLTRNFTSRNRQQITILVAGATLMVNLVLNLVFIPRLGVLGAALASFLSYSLAAVALLLAFHRESGIPIRNVLFVDRADLDRYLQLWQRIRSRRIQPESAYK